MEIQNKDSEKLVFTLRYEKVPPEYPIPVSQQDRVIQRDEDYYLFSSQEGNIPKEGHSRRHYQNCVRDLTRLVEKNFPFLGSLSVTYEIPKTESEIKEQRLGSSLDALNLTNRLIRVLENAGIRTVGDLTKKTELDLLEYRGLGRLGLKSIRESLSNNGLNLRKLI